ncbi:hypothetical protein BS50DRAFT_550590 [Corynespora cassiicola Philippines]|uniref:Uncharacterized protein n=1 Tax=Corynespora cassiicola Philippines TaxID=1448308 RepID=A0A2T2NQD4_CORCC|nr:hypothetical protein BS50DRAFT_550590 [Corynespora cassiicola Philippines]
MPIYRSINIALHSQFGIEQLPEYRPQSRDYYSERDIAANPPLLVDELTSTCSVYIPVFPSSQFWISYYVSPPVPDEQHFLFKLYINGIFVFSWGTGIENNWKGKTMFGLYRQGGGANARVRWEKRSLFFSPPDRGDGEWKGVDDPFDENAHVEIRVHRAHGRRRAPRQSDEYANSEHAKDERAISLMNAGRAGADHPKRFYRFALIDPLDQPFATFRYYYRTWDQVEYLGLQKVDEQLGEDTELSIIEPYLADESVEGEGAQDQADEGSGAGLEPPTYIPQGDSGMEPLAGDPWSTPSSLERPPLDPPSRPPPSISRIHYTPAESEDTIDLAHRPEDWSIETPSPIQSLRQEISTPPPGAKRRLAAASLFGMIKKSLKRRGASSSDKTNDPEG